MSHSENKKQKQLKKQTKQMALIIAVIIVAAAVIFGGGAFLFTQLFSGHIKTPSEYTTLKLKADTYTSSVTCEGTVKAAKTVSVSPEVDGTVKSIKVEEGDEVKKGDVLMTLKNDAITSAAETAQTNYDKALEAQEKAQASYDSAAESVKEAKSRKEKAVRAAQKQALKEARAAAAAEAVAAAAAASDAEAGEGAEAAEEASTTSDADDLTLEDMDVTVDASYDSAIETAQATQESAKASLEAAKSNTSNAKEANESAQDRAALLKVRATSRGTVLNLKAEEGMSTAMLNAQGPAMQVSDLSTLLAVVDVPESSASAVVRGQEANVTGDTLGADKVIRATVTKVSDVPNESDSQDPNAPLFYKATLTLGSDSGAKVGMTVHAEIELQDFGTVYYVPESAIRDQDGATFVEVVYSDDTSAQRQVIVVGHTDNEQAVIDAGTLVPGTTIRADLDE